MWRRGLAIGTNNQPILPRWLSVAIYSVAAVLIVGLLVLHVANPERWKVDTATYVLIGVLLVIPIAERLRKIKVGKYAEAEFAQVWAKVDRLGDRLVDLSDRTLSPDERSGVVAIAPADLADPGTARGSSAVAKTIRRIVWVDDRPANNRLEIDELRRRFDVTTATTTQKGLAAIEEPEATIMITDAVRDEGGRANHDAGVELLNAVAEKHPAIPVYVYCSQKTAVEHLESLEAAGARLVTSSFTELARQIRADARSSFEAEVAARLAERGSVASQAAGVDFVLSSGSRRIGVEAKDFRRTPKAAPFDAALARLVEAVEADEIDEGMLVTPRDVFIAKQRERTPDAIRLVSINALPKEFEQTEASARP